MQKENTNTANYLELKFPVREDAQWFFQLSMEMLQAKIPVRWQRGFFHITAVFVYDNQRVTELREAFSRVLAGRKAPKIKVDKLDAFLTSSGREIILNLSPSQPSEELLALINDLRTAAQNVGAHINPNFLLHITIGRIDAREAALDDVRRVISAIDVKPVIAPIRDINYLYLANHTPIAHWTLE